MLRGTDSITYHYNIANFKWVRGGLLSESIRGNTYLALNTDTGEMMAVKQVEVTKAHTGTELADRRQAEAVDALKVEVDILSRLDHPNIVQYIGFDPKPDILSVYVADFPDTVL